MEGIRFDEATQSMTTKGFGRRALIAFGMVTGLGTALGISNDAEAAKRCLNIKQRCKRHRQCCSGRCQGKKGKKRCRGHHAGTCLRGQNVCKQGPITTGCNGDPLCRCFATTGTAPFCGSLESATCTTCQRDSDCRAQGFPPGSACIEATGGAACKPCTDQGLTKICAAPCGTPTSTSSTTE